jgi:uncharacterized membrane protein YhaH (DUF805 family)
MLFTANGRIRRSQYWLWAIGSGFAMGIIVAIAAMLFGGGDSQHISPIFGIVYLIVAVLGIWIGVNLQIKRWHDRDKSGWWCFIAFVPIIGGLWVLIECGFLDGTQGPNKYGPSPKGIGAAQTVF